MARSDRIADTRIYAYRNGRRVLVAAPGDVIPPDVARPQGSPSSTRLATPSGVPDEVVRGSVPEVVAWVGDDVDRAKLVFEHEAARSSPRSTLVEQLRTVIG